MFIDSHKGGLIKKIYGETTLMRMHKQMRFINLLVDWYQEMTISESLSIVNLTPVVLKTFQAYIRDGSEQKI